MTAALWTTARSDGSEVVGVADRVGVTTDPASGFSGAGSTVHRMSDPASAHVLVVTSEPDSSLDGEPLAWVEHPESCWVHGKTARDIEIAESMTGMPVCELIDAYELLWTIGDWPLPPGRYIVSVDFEVSGGRDGAEAHAFLRTEPFPETEPEPEFTIEPVRLVYGGAHMRSLHEVTVAALLDTWQIEWLYERSPLPTTAGTYVPDFFLGDRPPWLPPIIEVKPKKVVMDLAEALGMPSWDATRMRDRPGDFNVGPVSVDPGLLDSHRLRKPFALANERGVPVWVVGDIGTNQPYVVFHGGGTASVSRQCPLFADSARRDAAAKLKLTLRDVTEGD